MDSRQAATAQDWDRLMLSSGDFGLAYLTERWAAKFVRERFRNYTVCFVGYVREFRPHGWDRHGGVTSCRRPRSSGSGQLHDDARPAGDPDSRSARLLHISST